jgi:hypothetical protein
MNNFIPIIGTVVVSGLWILWELKIIRKMVK